MDGFCGAARKAEKKQATTLCGLKVDQRLDSCRFTNVFTRFEGVFEGVSQRRILLGFNHHPAFIAAIVQQFEHRTEVDHAIARHGEGAFLHAIKE